MNTREKANVGGETMNKVYETLRTMTIEQIQECKRRATAMGREAFQNLFKAQCDYAIEKKRNGEW